VAEPNPGIRRDAEGPGDMDGHLELTGTGLRQANVTPSQLPGASVAALPESIHLCYQNPPPDYPKPLAVAEKQLIRIHVMWLKR